MTNCNGCVHTRVNVRTGLHYCQLDGEFSKVVNNPHLETMKNGAPKLGVIGIFVDKDCENYLSSWNK